MALNGYSDELNGYNTVMKGGAANNVNHVKAVVPPIGSVIAWMKTFASADSGTTDGVTASKLIQSGQNFTSTVSVGMIVHNTTDSTYAYVTAVDDDENLSLSADVMDTGEDYVIYKTPYLPDGWAECDGSVLSDSDSPYNGATLPDMNSTPSFLRGNVTSGTTGGEDSHTLTTTEIPAHTHTYKNPTDGTSPGTEIGQTTNRAATNYTSGSTGGGDPHENRPVFVEVVWIMRVK